MGSPDEFIRNLGLIVIACPAVMVLLLGVSSLLGRPFGERAIGRIVQSLTLLGLLASLTILGFMLSTGILRVPIDLGDWVVLSDYHFHFAAKFEFDRLSVPFVIMSFVICGTVGAFANRYMHRERGFNRFFMFYVLFLMGMVMTSLAGTIETLFFGWELVGLSSALLVAFYHERAAPVRNGLRVWVVYRISDASLLVASVLLHHLQGGGDFDRLLGTGMWPDGHITFQNPHAALAVGLLLLLAAAGKSAMVPFSGWLPRAMEGPTPSSAVFYGALSVHLGAFLLLRVSPILDQSVLLCVAVVCVGLCTAVYAAFAGQVQTDIKSVLSFASVTQVGIIVAEIGCGLRYVALIHILGHACVRTLQFLRAPSLLQDYRVMEDAIGDRLPRARVAWVSMIPDSLRVRLYRIALERGYLDTLLNEYLARPFLAVFRGCDALERRWTDFLTGGTSRESEHHRPTMSLDDFT
ncbi:MAG TPA: proton-conducting transporter membrane subunit [Planctomycetaceae bacterium]|nr:proton-conducting transporter membrane subunit [Planctomycetaceae bacterium]